MKKLAIRLNRQFFLSFLFIQMYKLILFLIFFLVLNFNSLAQYKGTIWCFGDSAGIDFSDLSNPVPIASAMDTRGGSATICDSTGSLLFYASGGYQPYWYAGSHRLGVARSSNHQVMQNGDSLWGYGWYNEMTIIPNPADDTTFFLFTEVPTDTGFYFSKIDMRLNGGLGAVVEKNIQLESFTPVDALSAVKHANGRDWWVVYMRWQPDNNDFYFRLVTPDSISPPIVQSIGTVHTTNNGNLTFSKDGSKLLFTNYPGIIEVFDFDRCSGLLSNPKIVSTENLTNLQKFAGSCFSPSGNVIYVIRSTVGGWYLFQYDLTAANIPLSKDTIYYSTVPYYSAGGILRLAPDDKIYLSNIYYNGIISAYPYPDTIRNVYNENLGVIILPDNLGPPCDFQPYNFYLGGKRTYYSLPNNPNYELGWISGSPCDSLPHTDIIETSKHENEILIYPNPSNDLIYIRPTFSSMEEMNITFFNSLGQEVYRLESVQKAQTIDISIFKNGIYILYIKSAHRTVTHKIIKH